MAQSGGGTTSSTTTTQMSPDQKKLLGLVTPVLGQYIGPNGQVKASTYPGSTVAPVDPTTVKGENLALGYAMGPMQDTAQSALAGSSFLTSGKALDPRTNPYLSASMDAAIRPITENFNDSVLGNIRDNAQLAGQYGYNRQAFEENTANRDYLTKVADTSAGMANTNYQAGLSAMSSALATEPGVESAALLPGQTVAAVGQQRQALQQQQIDAAVQQYYQKQYLPLNIASQIAGMAFGMPGGSTQSTGQAPAQNSTMNTLMGLGSLGLGAAGLFASDARIKWDVASIPDALGIIKQLDGKMYHSLLGDEMETGLVAQEVQKVLPGAVKPFTQGDSPLLAVNYSSLVGVLINAVKELSARIEVLEGK